MAETAKKSSILVLGSTDHAHAEKCLFWGELPYIADFDVLIVDTTTLGESIIRNILNAQPDYFSELKEMIVEAQAKRQLQVFCIVSKRVSLEHYGTDIKTVDNYSWSPITPTKSQRGLVIMEICI